MWAHPGFYRPPRRLPGIERLQDREQLLSRRTLAAMHVMRYAFHQVPLLAGNVLGTFGKGRRGREAAAPQAPRPERAT
jgi:hypothetical protein